MSSDKVFSVSGAHFTYPDGTTALDGVSFDIAAGERVALLGANGSGKSTLLLLLCGLAYCTAGSISAFGHTLASSAFVDDDAAYAFRRRVQFVFQDADVQLFNATVEEEVAFGPLQMADNPTDVRKQVDAILDEVCITHLRDRVPYRLSGGEKRKVALASVLVLKPDVLLLDEPTAGLDPRSVGALLDILDRFHDGGGTVVVATHDLSLLREMADRAIVLGEDHRVHADAPVREILADRGLLDRYNLARARREK